MRLWKGRDWALGLAPQELAGRNEGLVFTGICLVALGLVMVADLAAPRHATVGAIALLPVAAAAWLLSVRLTVVVVAVAMVLSVVDSAVGAIHPITAATQLVMCPVLAVLARLAATSVLRSRREERAARTARASEEQARELERAKSEFLRLASHELRGPVAILRGYLTMLADGSLGELPPAVARVMPTLSATAMGMNHMVDQMLDTARLEDSRLQLKTGPADLAEVVREVSRNVELIHGRSHRVVCANCDQAMRFEFDRGRISTVLGNLVSNAIKYSPAGTDVVVSLERRGSEVLVHVADQGIGIAPEDRARLFTRFGRIESSRTRDVTGTGLGLYLSRELARLHGGDITLESEVDRGSTFTLHLPAGAPAGAAAKAPAREPRPERSAQRRIAG